MYTRTYCSHGIPFLNIVILNKHSFIYHVNNRLPFTSVLNVLANSTTSLVQSFTNQTQALRSHSVLRSVHSSDHSKTAFSEASLPAVKPLHMKFDQLAFLLYIATQWNILNKVLEITSASSNRFFTSFISNNKFCEKPNLPNIHSLLFGLFVFSFS